MLPGTISAVAMVELQVEGLAQLALGIEPPRLVMAIGVDGGRADFLRELGQFRHRLTAPQDQLGALGF